MKIGSFVLTRDSSVLLWGKIVGVAGLVTSGAVNPASFGLTDKQQHAVMVACALIGGISAQLSTSSLQSKAEVQQGKP